MQTIPRPRNRLCSYARFQASCRPSPLHPQWPLRVGSSPRCLDSPALPRLRRAYLSEDYIYFYINSKTPWTPRTAWTNGSVKLFPAVQGRSLLVCLPGHHGQKPHGGLRPRCLIRTRELAPTKNPAFRRGSFAVPTFNPSRIDTPYLCRLVVEATG